jgi:lysophospholipase L1-like esterase
MVNKNNPTTAIRRSVLAAMAIFMGAAAPSPALVAEDPSGASTTGACGDIVNACLAAGFIHGDWRVGKGFWFDCVDPIIQGRTTVSGASKPLPKVAPAVIAACKNQNQKFGNGQIGAPAGITSAFYLDLGASVSVGFQPTAAAPRGQRTNHGYANYLVALEAAKGVTLQLTQLGCPGESTAAMLNGSGSCYRSPATQQLALAVSFLRAHSGEPGLVTVDFGFNDVVACLKKGAAQSCLGPQLAVVGRDLPRILNILKAVAGPQVRFVGVGHYDPFLAYARSGAEGKADAAKSLAGINSLNRVLSDTYKAYSIPMADVAGAFKIEGSDGAAEACAMTWMCQPPPLGPNIHPNDVGYLTIANAIAAKIPATW